MHPDQFHLSLNVSDLPAAVAFFEKLFSQPPAKQRNDYAKFELQHPPLVLSLEPGDPAQQGSLNHVGFRFADAESLVAAQRALESAGVITQREEGVECCYSKQTKFWVHDLDQRLWEFYKLDGEIDHRGAGQTTENMQSHVEERGCQLPGAPAAEPATWSHTMGSPLEVPAGPFHTIQLRGSFNVPVDASTRQSFLESVFAALAPGGRLELHMLTCEEPVSGPLSLPGPASYVKAVPVRSELMQQLESLGLNQIELATFRSAPCFQWEGHDLRETRITSRRPLQSATADAGPGTRVVYKGPHRSITIDSGREFRRGAPVDLAAEEWAALRESELGSVLVELPAHATAGSCAG
jgi:catechol 2,3-dioxygenase-like lactoylglutathione lyase family enzyme